MQLHTISDYQTTARSTFLTMVEGQRLFAYVDTVGIPTIGVGLNLREHGRLILQSLGFDLAGTTLTGAALTAEQNYITQLLNAFNQTYPSDISPANQAFAAFNAILQARASNTVYPQTFTRGTQFEITSSVSAQLLLQVLDGYTVPGKTFAGYETVLDTWLQRTGLTTAQPALTNRDSRERLALLSLAFNSRVHLSDQRATPWNDAGLPTLLGAGITKALLNDDRAEAWYEIRYNSGTDGARRFLEADTFDLYNAGPLGEADYKAAYRVLTRHRSRIFGSDGTAGTSDDYEQINLTGLNTAISRGNALGIAVRNINGHLAQAQAFLAGTYGVGIPVDWSNLFVGEDETTVYFKGTDADVISGTSQSDMIFGESGADVLRGLDGGDVLYGGTGSDRLVGDAGADYALGGTGFDVYEFAAGHGDDTAADSDGKGMLVRSGRSLSLGVRHPDGTWVGLADGVTVTYTQVGSDLAISFSDNPSDRITVKNFDFAVAQSQGYLRVRLIDAPTISPIPTTDRDIIGDRELLEGTANVGAEFVNGEYRPVITDPTWRVFDAQVATVDASDNPTSYDVRYNVADELDNLVRTSTPKPNAFDNFRDSAGSDHIVTGGGDDIVNASSGGADFIEAGSGEDSVEAGPGADRVDLGSEDDFAWGGEDADAIFGGDHRDVIYGQAGKDWLEGGTGGDFLVGGSEDDALFADTGRDAGGQSIAIGQLISSGESGSQAAGPGEVLSGDAGNDVVLGGATADFLLGGSGSDVIGGGVGNDNILGDAALLGADYDWQVLRNVDELTGQYSLSYIGLSTDAPTTGGADVIYAGAGSDWVFAAKGDDYIEGGNDGDVLFGEAGDDVVLGGEGSDVLAGDNAGVVTGSDEGADYLDGGTGDDYLQGDGGDDLLIGGTGNDVLVGGAGKDTYYFNAGDGFDTVYDVTSGPDGSVFIFGVGYNSNDLVIRRGSMILDFGSAGSVHITSFNHTDPAAGPAFESLLFANGDTLNFGEVLDRGFQIDGTAGDDDGHDGLHPVLVGTAFKDRINGLAGNDELQGLQGDDTLDGGTGNDRLFGMEGNDSLIGGAGNDVLSAGEGADALDGGLDSDQLFGAAGDDVLEGGDGVDVLQAGEGNDTLRGGDGDDGGATGGLYGEAGDDSLDGGAGNDYLFGDFANETANDGADTLSGGEGNDQLVGGGGNDVLDGGAGVDFLVGESGNDSLSGGDGNDELQGGMGADTLAGGAGVDILEGGAGDDVYVFNLGDGRDEIWEDVATSLEILRFGAGIAAGDLTFSKRGGDLYISHSNGTDEVRVVNWYAGAQYQMTRIEFPDTSFLTAAQAGDLGMRVQHGGSGDDSLAGTSFDDTLYGFAGSDTLSGNGGNDTLLGGTGNDLLVGSGGGDTYRVELGDGNDTIDDSSGADALIFGAGIQKSNISLSRVGLNLRFTNTTNGDTVTINSWFGEVARQVESVTFAGTGEFFTHAEMTNGFLTLTGTANDDTLTGGVYGETLQGLAGHDSIIGGAGNDLITGGTGNDTLQGGDGGDYYYYYAGDGQDTIISDTGTNPNNFGNFLFIGPGLRDLSSITAQSNGRLVTFTGRPTDTIFIQDGAPASIVFQVDGTSANDTLIGTTVINRSQEAFYGYAGADNINGGSGDDWIYGGIGNDTLQGSDGLDRLYGEDGDDILDGHLTTDTAGNNFDQYHGGRGNDTLQGNQGTDFYFFNLGDGSDTIEDSPGATGGSAGNDAVIFGSGITLDMLSGRREVGTTTDLIVSISATEQIRIRRQLGTDGRYYVEEFQFADGSSIGLAAINNLQYVRQGTAGNDTLTGDIYAESLYGKAGNDTLSGGDSNDTLDGGTGNDLLDGGSGNDTYVIRTGEGQDRITDASGTDTVQFGMGITASGLTLGRNANDLVLSINGTTDSVTITDYLKIASKRIESFTFTDGSQLPTHAEILDQLVNIRGGAGDDVLTGSSGFDAMFGNEGNDTLTALADDDELYGGAGDDTLIGGTGNDTLQGGDGADVYQYALGDGSDVITDASGLDKLVFGTGIATSAVTTTRSGNNLVVNVNVTGNTGVIQVVNYFAGQEVEEIRFADGTIWDVATIRARILAASSTSGNDTILGYDGDDTINALAGNDTIQAFQGNDFIDGGTGADAMYGGTGNDTYVVDNTGDTVNENAGEGTDTVRSSIAHTLAANVENLTLTGTSNIAGTGNALDNTLIGNGGRNTLTGGDGNDWLEGGAGNDTLVGGNGDDTYVMDTTSDSITENAGAGTDTVRSSIAWTLGTNLENLTLLGTTAINGTGNTLNNTISGNSANNTLTGGAGNDWLEGGAGNDTTVGGAGDDTHVVDATTDVTTENLNEGTDTVRSSVTWTLGTNLEHLTLTGTANINGTGNASNNTLTGNAGNNSLTGNAGNDTLDGGAGSDTLTGGTGNDTYVMGRGYGADTVVENDATAGNTDVAQFLSTIATDQIWFRQLGSNLEVSIIGTSDALTVQNWYAGSANHVEQFKTADGKTLLDSNVQNLVNAMAAFSPPAPGQTTLPPEYATALNPVIAANWQ